MKDAIREQWALLVIAVAALFGGWTLFTQPAIQEKQTAQARLAAVMNERDATSTGEQEISTSDNAHRTEQLVGIRFGKNTLIGEQDRLHEIAGESGVSIARIDPGTRNEGLGFGPLVLQGSSLQVEAAGSYDAIAVFLSKLSDVPACMIEDVSIRNSGSGDDLDVSLRIRTARIVRRNGAVAEGGFFE